MNVLLLHKKIVSWRKLSFSVFNRFVIISMCFLLTFFFLYLVVLDSYSYTAAYNYYCGNDDWCEKGKHIMCDPSAIVSLSILTYIHTYNIREFLFVIQESIGKFKRHMPSTFKIRYMFLELHNQLRNQVAGLEKATRMRNLIWDSELAFLARTYTGLCPSKPSVCHKTARFEKVGLNTSKQDGLNRVSLNTLMTTTFQIWRKDDSTFYKVLTHDQASRVGCAIGYCVDCPEGKE